MTIVRLSLCLLIACTSSIPGAVEAQQDRRKLLAVFAHPDDERIIGPLLARYAREGHDVSWSSPQTDAKASVSMHGSLPATRWRKSEHRRLSVPRGSSAFIPRFCWGSRMPAWLRSRVSNAYVRTCDASLAT
jgi:hypothetical protein